jgi:hypothetical protein
VNASHRPSVPTPLVLETSAEIPSEPDSVADAPLVAFDAFMADHRVYGWVRLNADRLTDIINAQAKLTVMNAQLERLPDGRTEWHERLTIDRDELLAVRAGGPRGDPAQRHHVRLHPLVVQSGPYLLGGFLHADPHLSPQDDIDGRPAMVPLSLGWLEYWFGGGRRAQSCGTILFNRGMVDVVRVVRESELEFGAVTFPIEGVA